MLTIKRLEQGWAVIYPAPNGKGEFVRVLPNPEALVRHILAWTRSASGVLNSAEPVRQHEGSET